LNLDPEMAAYLEAGAAAMREIGLPSPDASPQIARDFQERLHRATRAAPLPMAEVADRWIDARGRRIFCRFYRPVETDTALPVILYFHGGGWYFSSVETHDNVARLLAHEARAAVVNVDYALSPEAKFPQALEECAAVAAHVVAAGATWNLDGSRIVLAGDSAGGTLAIGAALLLRDRQGPPLRGVFAAYPACDSNFTTESYREYGTGLPLTAETMQFFWRNYVRDAIDMLHPLAAPLRADLRGLPPTFLAIAELDVLQSEAVAFADKLRAAGVDVTCNVYGGLTHGFMRATTHVSKARSAADDAGRWLRTILSST
jgi:acetyl esterase